MLSPQQLKAMAMAKKGVAGEVNTGVADSTVEKMPYLTIGRGSQAIKVPTATVIQHLQDPNSLVKTTRKDWDYNNLSNLQAQLDYDDRIDGSGVQMLRYLADRVEKPKGKKSLPLNPQTLATVAK